jgi:FHS family Na+ dependent glucose MFS transporter 1
MTTSTTILTATAKRLQRRQTAAYFIAFIGIGLIAGVLGPTLPWLAENTGSRLNQISVLFTALALGWLVGSLVSGRWYDRAPAHPLIGGLILLAAAMLALAPLVPALALLAAIMFVVGFGGGAIDVGGNTLLIWIHQREVGPRMNALHFFFGVGSLLAPLIVAQTIDTGAGVAGAFWLIALLLIAPGVFLLRTPSPANPLTKAESEAVETRWLLVFLIALMFFLFVGAELAFGGWIYTYALSTGLGDITTAGYINSLFWGALTLGRLLSIPLPTRLRPRYILTADISGLLISLSLLLFAADAPGVIWIASFGMGFSMANVFPTLMLLAEHHLNISGHITSLFLVGASLGGMAVPWLIGQNFESYGPQATVLWILGTVLATVFVLAIFLWAVRTEQEAGEDS